MLYKAQKWDAFCLEDVSSLQQIIDPYYRTTECIAIAKGLLLRKNSLFMARALAEPTL